MASEQFSIIYLVKQKGHIFIDSKSVVHFLDKKKIQKQ